MSECSLAKREAHSSLLRGDRLWGAAGPLPSASRRSFGAESADVGADVMLAQIRSA